MTRRKNFRRRRSAESRLFKAPRGVEEEKTFWKTRNRSETPCFVAFCACPPLRHSCDEPEEHQGKKKPQRRVAKKVRKRPRKWHFSEKADFANFWTYTIFREKRAPHFALQNKWFQKTRPAYWLFPARLLTHKTRKSGPLSNPLAYIQYIYIATH